MQKFLQQLEVQLNNQGNATGKQCYGSDAVIVIELYSPADDK